MDRARVKDLRLGKGELFVHDRADLADYDAFFELVIGNGEMMGRVDALHSQHLRGGAKKDVLCVRLVDLWGEQTYPIHRGRPGGRFLSHLESARGGIVGIEDLERYRQELDPRAPVLRTSYTWARGGTRGENQSSGFMSKARTHVMAHRYVDTVRRQGWKRRFTIETIFPYHSRASVFYIKKPYNPKTWAWGEVEHENEIEPVPNATVSCDETEGLGVVQFSTEFPGLATRVAWAVMPSPKPDSWEVDREKGSLSLLWDLPPDQEHAASVVTAVMTDRDSPDPAEKARDEVRSAFGVGWAGLEREQLGWWTGELGRSSISVPEAPLQKLYDISLYYLLNSVGGSYWGFIGVDNVVYETCMCDNPIMLHALVETNHLDRTRGELALFDRYLPAARHNASERMRVVLGIENREALLIPFYMTEDGVELWQDNVLGMYTSMLAFHSLMLLKTGSYTMDEEFMRATVYPWLRGYAEYGRLHARWDEKKTSCIFPMENVGGAGEGLWYRQTMSPRLYRKVFSDMNPMFRYADFARIELFPKDEIAKLSPHWIDAVANFRWILGEAARLSERFGLDEDLRGLWKATAAGLRIPQDDEHLLSNGGTDAVPSVGGPAVGTVFWPAEGSFEDLDPGKVERTMREILRQRRLRGVLHERGRAWDAVFGFTFAYYGLAEDAHDCLDAFAEASDPRGIEMRESTDQQNYYYLLNHGSLVLLVRYMLLQTYRDRIRIFPAVPADWRSRGVSFAGLPAEHGLLVDASTARGSSDVAIRDRSGKMLLQVSGSFPSLEIVPGRLEGPARELELRGPEGMLDLVVHGLRRGGRYSVECGGEQRQVTAGQELRFAVRAPAAVRITPIGA